ncbi:hypothetical protein JTB14_026474 [Gonioctena quinquepunctata]|nr:hypothetical protein JTB14_026474 [Gonioctena quinquepunctata]
MKYSDWLEARILLQKSDPHQQNSSKIIIKMDEEFKITDKTALVSKNTCKNCKKLLNVTPIFCIEENNLVKEICGRCSHIIVNGDGKKWRQHVYENFAQFVTYPCSNKKYGCEAVLNWNQVLDHEIVCMFQSMHCPLSHEDIFPGKSCNWVGNVKKLNEHIEAVHKDCIVNPPHYDWVDAQQHNHIFFTIVSAQLITIVIKWDIENKYSCLIMINGNDMESQCFRYQLELFDESKENSIIVRKTRLEPLGCMMENLKNPEKMLEVDIDVIKDMLRHTNVVHGRFGIVKKNKKEIQQITGVKDHDISNGPSTSTVAKEKVLPIDETMLQELECPVCNEFMIPPIFICQAGHSICNDCKSKVNNCPNCRSHFLGARNFTLENLTMRVPYPCRNREIGCPFVTTSEKIRGHEDSCELSETPCILRCGHKCLRPSMYNHVTEIHPNLLLQLNTVLVRDTSDRKEAFFVLYAFGDLFRFSIKGGSTNPYKFNVQHMGMQEEDPKYRYQLQFIDQSPLALNLSLTNLCQTLTEIPNRAHTNAVNLPWDLLKPLIFDAKFFYYKIIISKI